MSETARNIVRLKNKYVLLRGTETLLLSLAVFLAVFALCWLLLAVDKSLVIATAAMLVFAFLYAKQISLLNVSSTKVLSFLNAKYEVLESSADLLVRNENELNPLQRLQLQRVSKNFENVYPTIKFPNRLWQSVLVLTAGIIIIALASSFRGGTNVISNFPKDAETPDSATVRLITAGIRDLKITVTPPAYTGVRGYETANPGLRLPEGSIVQWSIDFTKPVTNASIVFPDDSLSVAVGKRTIRSSTFYQLKWKTEEGKVRTSDYYKIEAITDAPPQVALPKQPQFRELTINDKPDFQVAANISDDYGLTDAYIIATVSKGSGESVKFREAKLPFDRVIKGRSLQVNHQIDLQKLGLEPGDELYFYVEAHDNKTPVRNRNRTETYFVALKDTARDEMSVEGGLGVDLMPEYFRSQRQIIIDSEKLLRERKVITKQEFNSRSNELGYDQKVLRLKYGEFLGEEFESGIGPTASEVIEEHTEEEPQNEEGDDEDVTSKYGHQHDTENEHNLVQEKKAEPGHAHDEEGEEGEEENPMAEFLHSHDNAEEATFFAQSIRAKLKAALAVMWDAELHLRLFDPEKSLPFQYQALKLLKEISNDSRIYVHKTGFDPPPLKEEKRLTGDLAEVRSSKTSETVYKSNNVVAIRKAIAVVETLLTSQKLPDAAEKEALLLAGTELAVIATREPGRHLEALSAIQAIVEDEVPKAELSKALRIVMTSFLTAVPSDMATPSPSTMQKHKLEETFINKLQEPGK